jgi:hypothetical protein
MADHVDACVRLRRSAGSRASWATPSRDPRSSGSVHEQPVIEREPANDLPQNAFRLRVRKLPKDAPEQPLLRFSRVGDRGRGGARVHLLGEAARPEVRTPRGRRSAAGVLSDLVAGVEPPSSPQ